jgi:hypothetical protein
VVNEGGPSRFGDTREFSNISEDDFQIEMHHRVEAIEMREATGRQVRQIIPVVFDDIEIAQRNQVLATIRNVIWVHINEGYFGGASCCQHLAVTAVTAREVDRIRKIDSVAGEDRPDEPVPYTVHTLFGGTMVTSGDIVAPVHGFAADHFGQMRY